MAAMSAMDVGESHIPLTLSIHEDSSDSEREESAAEMDLDRYLFRGRRGRGKTKKLSTWHLTFFE
jgi:hypothetical protein